MTDEHINKLDKIDLSTCSISLREDGIIHLDFKKMDELKINQVKEIIDVLKQNFGIKKYPTLITVKHYILIEREVRELWASKEHSEFSIADAMVVNHVALKMVANFYIAVNKPVIPTLVFNTEEKAIEWLKTFL